MPIHDGEVRERISVKLGGGEYLILPKELSQQLEPFSRPQRWKIESKPVAQIREPRAAIRPGDIDGEVVGRINDWSRGIAAIGDQRPGHIIRSEQCNGFVPGTLRANPTETHIGITAASSIDPSSEITIPIVFNAELFVISGRYVTRITAQGAISVDKDFGSGVRVTSAVVWNSELVVGFGGSTNTIQVRNTGGTWTAATDATYVDHFTVVQDRLWRATATNAVSNISSAANPRTLANWSAGIAVGDVTIGTTDLNALGERVLVSKPEGLFSGDAAAVFENKIPSLQLDPDNGKNTLVIGADVFFPHSKGCILYREGRALVEIGLHDIVAFNAVNDSNQAVPGYHLRSVAAQGEYIWAAAEPSGYPSQSGVVFLKTVDSGVGYTDYSTEVTDNDLTTRATLGSLNTVANGDWVVVGLSNTSWNGMDLEFSAVNSTAAVLTVEYWNGTAWVAAPMAQDLTVAPALASPSLRGTITLSRSGRIMFQQPSMTADWTLSTLGGYNRYFIRLSVNAAIAATVNVTECRILRIATGGNALGSSGYLYRGRPTRPSDNSQKPVIWEPYAYLRDTWLPTGLQVVDARIYPYSRQGAVLAVGNAQWTAFPLPRDATSVGYSQSYLDGTPSVWTPWMDFGTPTMRKQLTRMQIHGMGVTAPQTVNVRTHYDNEGAGGQSSLLSFSTNDGVVTAFLAGTFYRLRLRIEFPTSVGSVEYPVVLEWVECTVRELPTYKDQTVMQLWIADGLTTAKGGVLPDAKVMLTNLRALMGTAGVTQIDPVGVKTTVTVLEVEEQGVGQAGLDVPWLACSVRTAQE